MSKSLYAHCCEIGRFGGLSKSDKKKKAARANLAKARQVKAAKDACEQEAFKKPKPWQVKAW